MDFLGLNSFETIEATQQRLDQKILALDHERSTLQKSEANVREKTNQVIHKQRLLLRTDRSSERQQHSSDLQLQRQRLATAERAIRLKLDNLPETETRLLHAFRNLEDRIVLDKAMKTNRLQEQQQQQQQQAAQAISEKITKLIEDQSRAVRRLQQEEAEQKRQQQQKSKETTKQSTKEKINEKKQKKFENGDDACSICLIPVSYYTCGRCIIRLSSHGD